MHIRLAEKNDQHAWDEYVLGHERSGPYHLFAWRQAVEKAYHHSPRYLIAENEAGKIEGVLPLILVKPPFLRGHLVSLPFCDYGGPLADNAEAALLMIRKAMEISLTTNAKLEIRCAAPEPSVQAFAAFGSLAHKSRMLLDLPGDSETLWNSFKSKLRSQIRRPQKDGMTFKLGSAEYVDDFYHVFSRNMKELGSPVHARAWIGSVIEAYRDRVHIGMVYMDKIPVAGGIILDSRDLVSIPWASALSEYSRSSPNMLLYWGLLQYVSDSGFRQFDFGRSTPGEGTYHFKLQWGAAPNRLYWYGPHYGNGRGQSASGTFRKCAEKIWSQIPQVFTDSLGPRMRKFITL